MIKFEGYYYNGRSSAQIPVAICIYESGDVLIRGDTLEFKTSVDQLSIATRLGNTRRYIFLGDGAKLETEDNAAVDQVCAYFDKNMFNALLHRLEKNWSYALIALFVSVAFVWSGIEYGVPIVAKWVAKSVPHNLEREMGEQGLETLDEWLFSCSAIDKAEQARLQNRFKSLVASSVGQFQYRLMLRSSKQMGANALALPGGTIILTDDLFELAENDEQILAVLAHEMGHIEHQHGLRSLFQDSLTALFLAGLLGDMTSVTSLSATLPTILVQSRYSREFEQEADQYAVHFLRAQNIKIEHFIRILTLLEQPRTLDYDFDYLSSHPAMNKRIARIQALHGQVGDKKRY